MIVGTFSGWLTGRDFGFVKPSDGSSEIFVHRSKVPHPQDFPRGTKVKCETKAGPRGIVATAMQAIELDKQQGSQHSPDPDNDTIENEEIEALDTEDVDQSLLIELSKWKREAKAEDNDRYFWDVREVAEILEGDKYFVIGRKGAGKTAICEHIKRLHSYEIFSEKLSFKNFPFNELYSHTNKKYTQPNQYITIWKYLIYSSICRLMIKNEGIDSELRQQLVELYGEDISLSRRVDKWVGREFGISLFGVSFKIGTREPKKVEPKDWYEHVDLLEDLLLKHAGHAKYFVLFDELDEDYRDIVSRDQYEQYTALMTSLFKAVLDVRSTFADRKGMCIYPVIFLRDDIYEVLQDSDKNKWGDFKVDLNWDLDKIKSVLSFRISRAIDPECSQALPFDNAWARIFGKRTIGVGKGGKKKIETFDYIARSTLLRPRDFVAFLQTCAQHAIDSGAKITPEVVKKVDKGFSNYLRGELTDELFAILPDISSIFDAISQLRKWNFSIGEFERAYARQVEQGFIKQGNVRFVMQVLFLFSVIGNMPRLGWLVFRYQNREARLNYNERIVIHRGLFKSLQIL